MTEEFVNLTDVMDHLVSGKSLYSECEKCCVMVQRASNGAFEVLIWENADKTKSPWRFGQMNDTELMTFMVQRSENWKFSLRNQPTYIEEK
jgi:hypothetical protein